MSESAPVSSGSESSAGTEGQSTDSTANSSSESSAPNSSGGSSAPITAEASQEIVEALGNAEKVGSMFEVVIDGEKVMLTKEQLTTGYQKAAAANKRFQEASKLKKEAEDRAADLEEKRSSMLKNPLKVLMDSGIDEASARKHYEEAVWQWLQQDQMTPEQKAERVKQKEHETEKQQLAREKAEIEAWKAERAAEKEAKEVEKHQNDFAAQLATVLEKHALPKSPAVTHKLIEIMKEGLRYDDSFTFEDAAEIYKEDHQSSIESYLKSLTPEQLMAKMGPDFVKQWRKQDVQANVKNPTPAVKKPSAIEPKSTDNKISAKDLFARR